ncbi:MAG TPA: SDR family NAD(P)-dependent oxidoreductase [Polyangiaceae bacterium]|nr:SDR family NAD(P)-dependent oxidoreductase [Polyangiaceae bacterium]
MKQLQGRRIVLTGASRGVGYETVQLFSREGAEIIGIARNAEKLAELERSVPGFEWIAGDVTDPQLGGRVASAVAARWGALDLLINNAAIQEWNGGFREEPVDALERNFQANVLSAHYLTHALLPQLLKGNEPRVINVSSGAGKLDVIRSDGTMPAYRLTKLALNGLTMLHAADLAGKVAVNSLDPGWLKTDLGGPNAPGEPADGARRMLELTLQPFEVTGRFFHGEEEIAF